LKTFVFLLSFFTLIEITGCGYFAEQEKTIRFNNDIRVEINIPSISNFDSDLPVNLVLYALPNGNTIEHTKGKLITEGDDWHYDIQHIAAQSRFIRKKLKTHNFVVAYLENDQKSWPAWKKLHENYSKIILFIVDSLRILFENYNPVVSLSGHSGGGSFINAFIEISENIPGWVKRITFLDSNYGYNNEIGEKIIKWLKISDQNKLVTLAYNDSIALYKGKSFVSPKGGTWYKSRMMIKYFSNYFDFEITENKDLIYYKSTNTQVLFILKKNPEQKIFHTEQVELNGFIHVNLFGTKWENFGYKYFSERAYQHLIR
jgi:hypothetical protein